MHISVVPYICIYINIYTVYSVPGTPYEKCFKKTI